MEDQQNITIENYKTFIEDNVKNDEIYHINQQWTDKLFYLTRRDKNNEITGKIKIIYSSNEEF